MQEFIHAIEFRLAGDFFFEEILDGLHIMIGCSFDLFDAFCIGFSEIFNNKVEKLGGLIAERRNFCNCRFCGQRLEPFYLNGNTLMNKAKFAEQGAQ